MKDNKLYRYPGIRPFTTNDSEVFFGREAETDKLFKAIMLERIVVLFGKSGHGKSSLINAGIVSKLKHTTTQSRFNYTPLEIRIGKVAGQTKTPVEKVISKLNEHFPDQPECSFLDDIKDLPSLWYHFKKKQSAQNKKFILIFDQFEEFFAYPDRDQEHFRWQLADLLYTGIPEPIRERIDDLPNEHFSIVSEGLEVKILFSIRSDRLSLLHSMKDALPEILHYRYEIKALRLDQAKDAIQKPAFKKDDRFLSRPFFYDDAALKAILTELVTVKEGGYESVEAFHLQIICQACEARIMEKAADLSSAAIVTIEDLPVFTNLYKEYYKRQIGKLPLELRRVAQTVLEETLLLEDAQTGEARRLSVDGNILKSQLARSGGHEDLLERLENIFLIRREPNTVGGFSYEISHDLLIEPMMGSKRERRVQREMQSRMEEVRQRAKRRAFAKRKRLFAVSLGLLVLLVGLTIWNWNELRFGYLTWEKGDRRPTISSQDKLRRMVDALRADMVKEADSISLKSDLNSWEASQVLAGLGAEVADSIKRKYLVLTSREVLADSCCCWRENVRQNDFRASGWVVSTIGRLGMARYYRCNILSFFLQNQLDNGAWSMLEVDPKTIKYSSTYATCHVIRSLYNTLLNTTNLDEKSRVEQAIDRAGNWVLWNMDDSVRPIWTDYPENEENESIQSGSLSGLSIHTLNLLRKAPPDLNQRWLRHLRSADAMGTDISFIERSDMLYKLSGDEAVYRDITRHLMIPWEVIATVDAYKDGTFSDKVQANIWLDHVIGRLQPAKVLKNPGYVKAEIFIALKYLEDRNYTFQ